MYIQEVIIDGFKSYAQRTVVSGFDPQFNAITGLNGSGKSNILDAICFVLGISNLTQVRVGNLQELVYKQGQAGVTKATVTIVFNNTKTDESPVGYESDKQITVTRQVVIGGKNKYMINGRTVQQSQVANLFHSVQLNVNNPHFLIMQGRITKVLNMKPEETLSMIEEAAGTRMFETKKLAALKTIDKKQLKVQELTKCLDEEITPTLDSLRAERQAYITWQSNNVELEKLERFCVAAEFDLMDKRVTAAQTDRATIIENIKTQENLRKEMQIKSKDCEKQAKDMEIEREKMTEGDLKALKNAETEASKASVKATTLADNHNDMMAAEKKAEKEIKSQSESIAKTITSKQKLLDIAAKLYEEKEGECTTAEQASETARTRYHNAVAGVADESSAALLSLPEQVGAWEKRAREAESQQKQGEMRSKHAATSLKELQKLAKTQQSTQSSAIKEAETLRAAVKSMGDKLAKMGRKNADEEGMKARLAVLKSTASGLQDTTESLNAQLEARLRFEFRDPEKGFDRSRVKGLVARLVKVKDNRAATALEIAAGAKLTQVIVDTETTGKLLLEKGQLKKRVTILPLNKINNRCTDPAKVANAKKIAQKAGGTAQLALELVGYDADVSRAMEYVFGNTIICDTGDVAKAVAFDPSVKNRTVTLEGDDFNPAGTLTGGSNTNLGVILNKVAELSVAQEKLDACQAEIKVLVTQLKAMTADSNEFDKLTNDLDAKNYALQMCEEKLAESSYAQTMNQISSLEQDIATCEQEKITLTDAFNKANTELKRLKTAAADMKKEREKAMKAIEADMKSTQATASNIKKESLKLRAKRDTLVAEIEALTQDTSSLGDQQKAAAKAVERMEEEAAKLAETVKALKAAHEDASAQVEAKKKMLAEALAEIRALYVEVDNANKTFQTAELEIKELTHKRETFEKDQKDLVKLIAALVKANPWITQEKSLFGAEGSDYDFAATDVNACLKRLKDIKVQQEQISKKINKKVMGMIEKAESEYTDLTKKREVILNDKAKIEDVIAELDVKKMQALQSTWVKVNRDFGSIFSMLLPGTHAKLDPPEGQTVTDGLEVKVAFNGTWKESLTELSGGQRSLLALSLILALLLFKPAPMYILDEVDAALDLSHTQNIGTMLRTHFQHSQFIVVSLKEGMFNNANVIFRTRFVDGVSAVIRTAGKPRSTAELAALESKKNEINAENALVVAKKTAKKTAKKAGKADGENTKPNLVDA